MLKEIESKINKSLLSGFFISDDKNKNGVWWNCKQAWKMIPEDSTHHIVLQDDMIPCDNFVETLLELIKNNNDNIIHIFGTNFVADKINELNERWFTSYDGVWGGAVLLPKKHFKWYECSDEIIIDHPRIWDDFRFSVYCMFNKYKIYNITPTLLDHKGYNISLIGNSDHSFRKANCLISGNPLEINWNLNQNIKNGLIYPTQLSFCFQVLKKEYKNKLLQMYNCNNIGDLLNYIKLNYYGNTL